MQTVGHRGYNRLEHWQCTQQYSCSYPLDLRKPWYSMKRDDVLRLLTNHRDVLRQQFGVKSLILFGSVARDEAMETSDVDLLVEFDRPVGLFGLFALQDHLAQLLGCAVDVGTPDSLKPRLRAHVLAEGIHVS